MRVEQIPNGLFRENCYVVIDDASSLCAIIDPGEEAALIARRIVSLNVTPQQIWLTHAHVDHVLGTGQLMREIGHPLPIALHPADRVLYDHVEQQADVFGMTVEGLPLPPPDRELVPGVPVTIGSLRFDVRATPGHSPGSVSFVGHGVVFTGDVLFQGSIGRTDLFGANPDALMRAIERELLSLPDNTIVYPGHGPATTIGDERRRNPFLTGRARPV